MARTSPPPPNLDEVGLKHLQSVIQRAEQGDATVLPELHRILDEHPVIWQQAGDLGMQAEASWLKLIAGSDLLLRESLGRKLEQLRRELGGSEPPPLEKLLVERIAACWLQLQHADALYAQLKDKGEKATDFAAIEKRQNRAQQRYMASIKTLATVRKLLRPTLSPFELGTRTVSESPGRSSKQRARCNSVRDGVAVRN